MHAGCCLTGLAACQQQAAMAAGGQQPRREMDQYAALFVALIGEGADPQGVVSTSDGRVVRAFHRFTLVDQSRALAAVFVGTCSVFRAVLRPGP
jgi:hypothetical protein